MTQFLVQTVINYCDNWELLMNVKIPASKLIGVYDRKQYIWDIFVQHYLHEGLSNNNKKIIFYF